MSSDQRRALAAKGAQPEPEDDDQNADHPSGQRAKDMGLPTAMEADREAGKKLAASIKKRREDMGVAQATTVKGDSYDAASEEEE